MKRLLLIGAAALLMGGCSTLGVGVKGSFNDTIHRPAGQMTDVEAGIVAWVYRERGTPQHWDELRRRGLVRDEFRDVVDRHEVRIGMNEWELQASIRGIFPINRTVTRRGEFVQWGAGSGSIFLDSLSPGIKLYIYTENGIVVAAQN